MKVKVLFCNYCRAFKSGVGFRLRFHPQSGTSRRQCPVCHAKRQLPRAELERLAIAERTARRIAHSEATKRGLEQRRKDEKDLDY